MKKSLYICVLLLFIAMEFPSCKHSDSASQTDSSPRAEDVFWLDPRVESRSTPLPGSTLYLPKNLGTKLIPGIVVLHGSEGGSDPRRTMDYVSVAIAAEGFAVLKLCWWGCPGRPPILKEVPLENTLKAVEWLHNSVPEVRRQKVGVFGFSRGGEHAAILASIVKSADSVAAIVLGAPADYFMPAFSWNPDDYAQIMTKYKARDGSTRYRAKSAFTYQGKSLEMHPLYSDFPSESTEPGVSSNSKAKSEVSISSLEMCLKPGESHPQNQLIPAKKLLSPAPLGDIGRIRVEDYKGPMLVWSGIRDALWPHEMSIRIKASRDRRHLSTESIFIDECHAPMTIESWQRLEMQVSAFFHRTLGGTP